MSSIASEATDHDLDDRLFTYLQRKESSKSYSTRSSDQKAPSTGKKPERPQGLREVGDHNDNE